MTNVLLHLTIPEAWNCLRCKNSLYLKLKSTFSIVQYLRYLKLCHNLLNWSTRLILLLNHLYQRAMCFYSDLDLYSFRLSYLRKVATCGHAHWMNSIQRSSVLNGFSDALIQLWIITDWTIWNLIVLHLKVLRFDTCDGAGDPDQLVLRLWWLAQGRSCCQPIAQPLMSSMGSSSLMGLDWALMIGWLWGGLSGSYPASTWLALPGHFTHLCLPQSCHSMSQLALSSSLLRFEHLLDRFAG